MENSKRWTKLFTGGIFARCWPFKCNDNKSNYHNYYYNGNSKYFWSVILVILCPARVLANTTVASPNSSAQGVVNNNATMITPSSGIATLPVLGGQTTVISGGTAGSLALTSLSSGIHTCTAGGSGTSCIASTTVQIEID